MVVRSTSIELSGSDAFILVLVRVFLVGVSSLVVGSSSIELSGSAAFILILPVCQGLAMLTGVVPPLVGQQPGGLVVLAPRVPGGVGGGGVATWPGPALELAALRRVVVARERWRNGAATLLPPLHG